MRCLNVYVKIEKANDAERYSQITNLWEVADYMTAVIIVLGHDIK